MKKRIFVMLVLLLLAVGLYALNVKADGGAVTVTQTAQPSQTATGTPSACEVVTGFEGGAVNLRTCAGTDCKVIRILTEGERLNILSAGDWTHVTTKDGVTGYINSNYCKGK